MGLYEKLKMEMEKVWQKENDEISGDIDEQKESSKPLMKEVQCQTDLQGVSNSLWKQKQDVVAPSSYPFYPRAQ